MIATLLTILMTAGDAARVCDTQVPGSTGLDRAYVETHFASQWRLLAAGEADDALRGFEQYVEDNNGPAYLRPAVYALMVSAQQLRVAGQIEPMTRYLALARDMQDRLPTKTADDLAYRISINLGLGMGAQALGDFDVSLAAYREAQAVARQLAGTGPLPVAQEGVATALAFEAGLAFDRRDYRRVKELSEEAAAQTRSPFTEVWLDIVLAAMYRQQGDYGHAQRLLEKSVRVANANCLSLLEALAARNLGEIMLYYKPLAYEDWSVNLEAALPHFRSAMEIYEALGRQTEKEIVRSHIGELHMRRGNYREAQVELDAALAAFMTQGFSDGIGRVNHHLGRLYRLQAGAASTPEDRLRYRTAAFSALNAALSTYDDLDDREWQWRSLLARGTLYESDNSDAAKADYKAATRILQGMRVSLVDGPGATGSEFSESYREPFDRLVAILVQEGRVEEALANIAASDAMTLRQQYLQDALASGGESADGECADLLLRYSKLRQRSVVTSLMHDAGIAEAPVATAAEEPQNAGWSGPVPPNSAFLTYRVGPDRVLALVRTTHGESYSEYTIGEDALRADVLRLVSLINTASLERANGWRSAGESGRRNQRLLEAASSLHDALIKPFETQLADASVDRLYIKADGVLELLPFSALATRQSTGVPEFLLDRYDVRRFAGVSSRPGRVVPDSELALTAFVNPTIRESDRDYSLPNAEGLAGELLRPRFGARVYLADDASKINFRSEWPRANMLHLGAHGIVTEGSPFLMLAPDKVQGRLSSCEILGLPFHDRMELVVLEACESAVPAGAGLGEAGFDRNLASLGAAFTDRGARNVVATLWRVGQNSSRQLMEAFYEGLARGDNPGDALRAAKLAQRNADGIFSQPYYWAGFTIFETLEQGI